MALNIYCMTAVVLSPQLAKAELSGCHAECDWICAIAAVRSISWRCCDQDKYQESVRNVSWEILQYQCQ